MDEHFIVRGAVYHKFDEIEPNISSTLSKWTAVYVFAYHLLHLESQDTCRSVPIGDMGLGVFTVKRSRG